VRHTSRSLGWSANVRGKSGASGGRKDETRRGRNRFKGTRKIQWPCQLNRRRDGRHRRRCHRWRQHKGNRSEQRAIGITAAGHRAGYHSRHVMPAIHVIRRCNGSLLMMMRRNRALTGRAARGLVRRPSRSRKWRVNQNHHQQADACGNRTPPLVTCTIHFVPAQTLSSDTIA